MIPFFSRRIGLGANGTPQKIDFGTKMTGQLGRHDVGILHVRTGDDEDAAMIGEDFTVARVKRRVLRQSYVGGLFTRRDARGDGLDEKNTIGVDFRLATSTFIGSQNLSLTGWGLHASRARPDASGRTSAYGLPGVPERPLERQRRRTRNSARLRPRRRICQPHRLSQVHAGADLLAAATKPSVHPAIRVRRELRDAHRPGQRAARAVDHLPAVRDAVPLGGQLRGGAVTDLRTPRRPLRHQPIDYAACRERVQLHPASVSRPDGQQPDVVGQCAVRDRRVLLGHRHQTVVGLNVRARPGYFLYLNSEWNQVDLAEGSFSSNVYRVIGEAQFSPFVTFVNNFQYDTQSAVLGWQSRFRWIVTPGNDVYVVYTHNWLDDPLLSRFSTLDKRFASKVLYTYRF